MQTRLEHPDSDLHSESSSPRLFDVLHVRVHSAEDVPRMDDRTWCDASIALEFDGLGANAGETTTSPSGVVTLATPHVSGSSSPQFNHEFLVPIPREQSLVDRKISLHLRHGEETIGSCDIRVADALRLTHGTPPLWRSLMLESSGTVPLYRGRLLFDVRVTHGTPVGEVVSEPFYPSAADAPLPPTCAYRLDAHLLEGHALPGGEDRYEVHVTLGHTMGGTSRERHAHGKAWITFDNDDPLLQTTPTKRAGVVEKQHGTHAAGVNQAARVTSFLATRSCIIDSLPIVQDADLGDTRRSGVAFRGPASTLIAPSSTATGAAEDECDITFSESTLDLAPRLPDLIVSVRARGRDVAYLRVPVDGVRRATSGFAHGEEYTLFPHLLDAPLASARALPLRRVDGLDGPAGYLLMKLSLTPVTPVAAKSFRTAYGPAGVITSRLPAVPRERFQLVARVYQGIGIESGADAAPALAIRFGEKVLCTSAATARFAASAPNWFEALVTTLDLPSNLVYAPDLQIDVRGKVGSSDNNDDPDVGESLASSTISCIEAVNHPALRLMRQSREGITFANEDGHSSSPGWYALHRNGRTSGHVLLSFALTPVASLSPAELTRRSGTIADEVMRGWDEFTVSCSSMDVIGGSLAARLAARSTAASVIAFELESTPFGEVVRHSAHVRDAATIIVKRPTDDVFYSGVIVRALDEESGALCGTAAIPLDRLLRVHERWFRVIDLLSRDPARLVRRVLRRWGRLVSRREAARAHVPRDLKTTPRTSHYARVGATPTRSGSRPATGGKQAPPPRHSPVKLADLALGHHDSALADRDPSSEATPLLAAATTRNLSGTFEEVRLKINDDDSSHDARTREANSVVAIPRAALHRAMRARRTNEDGEEVFDARDLHTLEGPQSTTRRPTSGLDTHPRLACEWELISDRRAGIVDPFTSATLFAAMDEEAPNNKGTTSRTRVVGRVRARFHAFQTAAQRRALGGGDDPSAVPPATPPEVDAIFDAEQFFQPPTTSDYAVRVYVLRATDLVGSAEICHPRVTVGIAGQPTQRSSLADRTLAPSFYEAFEFHPLRLPASAASGGVAEDPTLMVHVWNEHESLHPELIGGTDVAIESRIFSKAWSRHAVKPIERRALRLTQTDTLVRGFIELCIEIVPLSELKHRTLDYLLKSSVSTPWELRVTVWHCAGVPLRTVPSNLFLVAGIPGEGGSTSTATPDPQYSTVCVPSMDGAASFNWRFLFSDIQLPRSSASSNLKLQIWNQSVDQIARIEAGASSEDDLASDADESECLLGEAVVPLSDFFDHARRSLDRATAQTNPAYLVHQAPRQLVRLLVPGDTTGSPGGVVQVSLELLPREVALSKEYRAADGSGAFQPELNAPRSVLPTPSSDDLEAAYAPTNGKSPSGSRCSLLLVILLLLVLLFGFAWLNRERLQSFVGRS